MRLIDAYAKLLSLKQPIFQTRDASNCLNIPLRYASKVLARLREAGFLIQLMRGQWAIAGQIDPLIIPEYLTAPSPCYISLQTALFHHGMISQIPAVVYAVSLARTHRYETPVGVFSVHHIKADFFFGFNLVEKSGIKMASPEKALLDTLYLSPTHSLLFKTLPELELPPTFRLKKARNMIQKIKSDRLRTFVSKKLKEILS